MADTILERCEAKGLRMTGQRRTIAAVLEDSDDHPDVEELYSRASAADPKISLATVYRTVKLFEEAGYVAQSTTYRFGPNRQARAYPRHDDSEKAPFRWDFALMGAVFVAAAAIALWTR